MVYSEMRNSRSGGQALIFILLVMSASLLIGAGVSFRSVSTLRQISFSEQSNQALSFAEAGAEYALKCLKDGSCGPGDSGSLNVDEEGGDDVDYTIEASGGSQVFTDFSPLERSKSIQVKLDGYPGDKYIHLYWVNTEDEGEKDKPAALLIHLVYLEGGVYKLKSYAFDPDGTRRVSNKFEWPTTGNDQCFTLGSKPDGTVTYQYRCRLWVPSEAKALRLTPLYNDGVPNTFAIYAPSTLPRQGAKITAEGQSGQAQRTVEVIRTDPILPGVFDFVYYSGSQL